MDSVQAESPSDATAEVSPSWSLTASVASRINVAFHQNAVPSIGEIALTAPADVG